MKNHDLFEALSDIDPRYVAEADRALKPRPLKLQAAPVRGLWLRWATVAACLLILLCAIPISRQALSGFAPIGTDDETTGSYVNPINPDFVIEDGVLLSYTGDSPHVIIPDEVREISRDAFAEKGEIIETITLGKGVTDMDALALAEVKSLSEIVVPESNDAYLFQDGILIGKDRVVMIERTDSFNDDFQRFIDLSDALKDGELCLGETFEIVYGRAVITITAVTRSYGATDMEDYYLTEIDFLGNAIRYPASEEGGHPFLYNAVIMFEQTDTMLMFQDTNAFWYGYYCFMTADHTYEHFFPGWDDPNASVYSYRLSDDGVFTYARYPYKYRPTGDMDELYPAVQNSAGFDELYCEDGYITFEDGLPMYHPTLTVTLGESGIKEIVIEIFEDIKENHGGFMKTHGRDFDTIEELFAYNREHFGMVS